MKQLQIFLQESSDHMSKALSRSRVTITCQDTELRYIWVFNPAEGYADAIGKKLEDFVQNQEQLQALQPLKHEVLKTKVPTQKVVSFTLEGQKKTYDLTVTPTFDTNHDLIGLTTIAVDLTDLLTAQEDLRQAQARLIGMLGDRIYDGVAL